ncbi:MAG: outer membrane protein TolC [Marinoscillum sp.]|jgi:outer membrane protein TolC
MTSSTRRKAVFRVLSIGLWFISTGLVQAQQPLTLSEAIGIGLERNYNIQLEQKNVQVSANNNTWGEAGALPTISLNLTQNNIITDNVKTAGPFQLQDITLNNSLSPSANLTWTIFNGFKVNMTKRRLDQLQAESEGNASIVISNTLQSIILGYYLSVMEQSRLEEFAKQLKLSADKYEYVKAGMEIGTKTSTDILLEEGNYLSDSVSYINQMLAFKSATRNLNVLLGKDDLTEAYLFTDTIAEDFPRYELENLKSKMLNNNADLKKQYITQALLGTNIGIARADRYPSLSLSAGASDNRSRVDLSKASFPNGDGTFSDGPSDPRNAVTNNYFANFTLSYALFNGGKINRAIKNSIIQEDIGNLRVDQLKNKLSVDLLDAYDRYEIRRQIYAINKRREASAKANLAYSTEKFRNGSINSFDFRVVQNNYLSASTLRLQALYDLMDTKVMLMRLTGGLVEEYSEDQ